MNLFAVHSFVFTYICSLARISRKSLATDRDQKRRESKSRGGLSGDLVTEMNLTISPASTCVFSRGNMYWSEHFNELILPFRSFLWNGKNFCDLTDLISRRRFHVQHNSRVLFSFFNKAIEVHKFNESFMIPTNQKAVHEKFSLSNITRCRLECYMLSSRSAAGCTLTC